MAETRTKPQESAEIAPIAAPKPPAGFGFAVGLIVTVVALIGILVWLLPRRPAVEVKSILDEEVADLDLGTFSISVPTSSPMMSNDELYLKLFAKLNPKLEKLAEVKGKVEKRRAQLRDGVYRALIGKPAADLRSPTLFEDLQRSLLDALNGIVGKAPDGQTIFVMILVDEFRPPRRGS